MTQVYLKLVNGYWKEVQHSDFHIDRKLLEKLKSLIYIQKKDWDGVIVIDGKERSGKSVLGMIMGWYLSRGIMGINNFARGLDDAAKKISILPDKSVLILDEGSLVFSSKDSMTNVQKKLIKLMDVIGQKNMVFIICLPCYFDLNKTIAIRRSLFLCHVYPDEKYNRGRYAFWGERSKKLLYLFGKKNYDSYAVPQAEFVGLYMNFNPPFYKDYLEKVKKESLQEVMNDAMNHKPTLDKEYREFRYKSYYLFKNIAKLSNEKIGKEFGVTETTIRNGIKAYKLILDKI